MPATRRRRIAKRIAVALAVPLLLASSYVSLYCVHCWNSPVFGLPTQRAGVLGGRLRLPDFPSWVFEPIHSYARSNLPGSVELQATGMWCQFKGDVPWKFTHEYAVNQQDRLRREASE
jgi:hypothetical protein